ncbi:unnamed protein product [Medioppia subpectinata]|uniref:C2H2-type domain-containing protein n=1 Tax=Medioppia subpectinata TaxID=1979941 RepID=A0A7R9L0Q5_9ACAR|nr:unnamed protein product [Medioppia subpectinata]CAG2113165.1 unnamed protein product [Medioppia subpectinata]
MAKQLTRVLVKSNDIFDELFDENKRLLSELLFANNCLMKLKTQLSHIYHTFETQLSAEDKHNYNELTQELRPLDAGVKREVIAEEINATPIVPKCRKRPKSSCDTNKTRDNRVVVKRRPGRPKMLRQELQSIDMETKKEAPSEATDDRSSSLVDQSISDEDNESYDKSVEKLEVKKRIRKRRTAAEMEELEELRQKYLNFEGIMDDMTGHYVCPKTGCDSRYGLLIDLYRHMRSVHELQSCGPEFQQRMDSHTKEYFDVDTNCYVCTEGDCRERIEKQYNFYRHLINAHNKRPDIVCDVCGKVFKLSGQMRIHHRIHTNTKPYKCSIADCGRQFRCSGMLTAHMTSHSDERPYHCQFEGCGKAFKSDRRLQEHSQTHDKTSLIKCSVNGCDHSFKNDYRRRLHVKLVHKGLSYEECRKVSKTMPCVWPGCEFRGPSSTLKSHHYIHTGERPYACNWPECGKRFRQKHHLSDHKNIHVNDKPLMCHWPGCGYRDNNSGNLRKHIRTKHK